MQYSFSLLYLIILITNTQIASNANVITNTQIGSNGNVCNLEHSNDVENIKYLSANIKSNKIESHQSIKTLIINSNIAFTGKIITQLIYNNLLIEFHVKIKRLLTDINYKSINTSDIFTFYNLSNNQREVCQVFNTFRTNDSAIFFGNQVISDIGDNVPGAVTVQLFRHPVALTINNLKIVNSVMAGKFFNY